MNVRKPDTAAYNPADRFAEALEAADRIDADDYCLNDLWLVTQALREAVSDAE